MELKARQQSHPSWVCGLKQWNMAKTPRHHYVTPFVGVWIETKIWQECSSVTIVTPFVGVWIETFEGKTVGQQNMCHTLRGCVD